MSRALQGRHEQVLLSRVGLSNAAGRGHVSARCSRVLPGQATAGAWCHDSFYFLRRRRAREVMSTVCPVRCR